MSFMNALVAKAYNAPVVLKNKVVRDFNDFKNGELSGQGLIEYVLIIAIISLVVIYAGPQVAKMITEQFTKIANELHTGSTGNVTPAPTSL